MIFIFNFVTNYYCYHCSKNDSHMYDYDCKNTFNDNDQYINMNVVYYFIVYAELCYVDAKSLLYVKILYLVEY